LDQSCRNGPELNIDIQPLEDVLTGQVMVADDLAVLGRILCEPAL
jgi:hypothetical protein